MLHASIAPASADQRPPKRSTNPGETKAAGEAEALDMVLRRRGGMSISERFPDDRSPFNLIGDHLLITRLPCILPRTQRSLRPAVQYHGETKHT